MLEVLKANLFFTFSFSFTLIRQFFSLLFSPSFINKDTHLFELKQIELYHLVANKKLHVNCLNNSLKFVSVLLV